jgi:hypothetical protein
MTNQTHHSTRMLLHFLVVTLLQNKYHSFILILLFSFGLEQNKTWGQTLGTYPSSMVKSGQNISITPSAAPTNTSSTVAYTNTNFMGVLSVDPTTGVVQVTNAQLAGTYTITVKAFGTATAITTFTLTITDPVCSQGLFKGMSDVMVGNDPRSVAIGDFNGDGKQDFAATNYNSNTVSILMGDGTGAFSGMTDVSVGTGPRFVAIGDFNGDGYQDLAVSNQFTNNVSILQGDGSGGFSGMTNVSVGNYPRSVAIGDFNGDGNQDFATANYNSQNVSIRLGDGQGGFSGTTNVSVGINPYSVAIGDFNSDGAADFATANTGSGTVSIQLGDGTGGFTGTTDVSVGSFPQSVAIGDFNGDGNQDLAVANYVSHTVSIRMGNGMGAFSGTTEVSAGTGPLSVAISDFNGDGNQDLAAANFNSDNVSIRLGDGTGGFTGTTNVPVGSNPLSVAVGDFNADGRQDFVAANSNSATVSIRLGSGPEINVQGNATDIADGDTSPSSADHTDFGSVSDSLKRTFTIQNKGNSTLFIGSISSKNTFFVVSGAPDSVAAGSSATFKVTFFPIGTGVKNDTITINNSDCDESAYDFAVTGTAICASQNLSITVADTSGTTNDDGTICVGANVSLVVSGMGTTYLWSAGSATTSSITVAPSVTTTYTVTVTVTSTGCTDTATQVITVNPLPPTPSITVMESSGTTSDDGTICNGDMVTLSTGTPVIPNNFAGNDAPESSLGTPALTYLWSNGESTSSIMVAPSMTTTYTLTVTNEGCTNTATKVITVSPLPTSSITVADTSGTTNNDGTICAGANVTLAASGGDTYLWSSGSATTSSIPVAPSMTTTYTVTVTATSTGCTDTSTQVITVNPLPMASIMVADTSGTSNDDGTICAGANVSLAASGGGTYLWSSGSATTSSITVAPSITTTYTVTVTATTTGCTDTSSQVITVNPLPPTPFISVTESSGTTPSDGTICIGDLVALSAGTPTNLNNFAGNDAPESSLVTSALTYSWSNGESTSSIMVAPSMTTTYTVTVTEAGCTNTATQVITVNPLPPTPSISVMESSGTTPNDGTICNGDMVTLSTGTPVIPNNFVGNDAPESSLATPVLTYLWSNGANTSSITVSPNITTTYTVTVTNSNQCSDTATQVITVNPLPPTPSITVMESSGTTPSDGTICNGDMVTLSAGTETIPNNFAGNDAPESSLVTPALTYLWSNGASTSSIMVAPSMTTTYTLTVTNEGCTNTATKVITVSPLPTSSITVADTSGTTNNDGTICAGANVTLAASGGDTYLWSSGSATTSSIPVAPSMTTTYTVTVTATSTGCTDTSTQVITVNPLPMASIMVADTSGTSNDDGTICAGANVSLAASGGGTYLWSSGSATTSSITVAPSITTTYTVTVTATTTGCTDTSSQVITVNPLPPTPFISVTESSGTTPSDGTICIGDLVALSAGTPTNLNNFAGNDAPESSLVTSALTYSWSNGESTSSIMVAPSMTTTYTVTVTEAGCTNTATQVITVNPLPPTPSISVIESSGTTPNDGTICNGDMVTLSTGTPVIPNNFAGNDAPESSLVTPVLTYLWSNGANTSSITVSPNITTTYTVTVTNSNQCSDTATQVITVNPLPPTPSIIVMESSGTTPSDGTICNGDMVTLSAGSSLVIPNNFAGNDAPESSLVTSTLTYSWSNGATTSSITVSPSVTTTYTLTVTNLGCTNTATKVITVNPLPISSITVTDNSGTNNNDGTTCAGANVSLAASGGDTYLWSSGSATTSSITVAPSMTTTYTVTVTTTSTGCAKTVDQVITVNALPTVDIDLLSFMCKDSTITFTSTINGATPYANYEWTQSGSGLLQITDNNDGTATAEGVNPGKVYVEFSLLDTNGCSVVSIAKDTLTVLNCNSFTAVNNSPNENDLSDLYMIKDPCTCKGNGLFDETVWVEPTSDGEVWTVSSIAPLRAGGAAPQNIAVGNTLSYRFISGPDIGIHEISFVHVDSSGFSVVIEGPNPLGSAGNVFLSINNECYYPDVALNSVPVLVSPNAAPFVITGSAANSATGIGSFTLNGTLQAGSGASPTLLTINPSTLPLSLNTLEYSFDADTAGSKNLSDPGCVQTISKTFQVADCNCKDITISLDVNCEFVLTANLVSDGNCSDGTVRVMDSNPNNGNIIDCTGVFTYGLYDDFDNLICMGQVTAEVTSAPVPCDAVLSSLSVTLDGNCQFNLTPQTVAAGTCTYANYRVVVQDNNQSNGGTIDCAGTWTYGLFDADGHLVAWGKVTAEDKTAPRLTAANFYADTLACFDVNYVLNNPKTIGIVEDGGDKLSASPKPAATSTQTILYAEGVEGFNVPNTVADDIYNLGYPFFRDNCNSCGCRVTLKWSDKVVYYSCADMETNGNIYAKIYREWVATDCNGMRSSVVQVIPFARPKVVLTNQCTLNAPFSTDNELQFRGAGTCGDSATVAAPNYDWVVQYTSCTPDKSLIQKVDVMPSFRSYFYNDKTKRDIYLDEAECNYSVQIKDTEFPTCGGKGLKIDREIYVFDWCAGGIIDTLHVLIKITDDQAPTLTLANFTNGAPYYNLGLTQTIRVVSTGPMDCTAAIPITVAGIKKTFGATIADNCTLGNVAMSVKTKDRYVKGILVAENTWDKVDYAIMNGTMLGLPTGAHRLIIDMSDGCYNAKRDSFDFYVFDGIAPVMKCNDQLNVSLSNGNGYTTGYAQVRVADLDAGSWDNCKLAWIKARRNVPAAAVASFIAKGYDSNNNGKLDAAVGNDINADGDYNDVINGVEEVLEDGADGIDINGDGDFKEFGETFVLKGGKLMTPLTDVVEFFCGDVAAKVTVELWAEDTNENRSFCWEEILIEDKVAPVCVAPFDITVDCDEKCLEKIDNKAVSAQCFGDVTITSGNDCAALDTVYSVSKDLKCGYGTIVRSWALTKQTAKGPITINCAQTITVRPVHQYNIRFPKDASADCKTPIIDTIITDELSCDILSVNVSDKRYDASDDECYKIFRTYSVINWCTYDDRCGDPLDQTNITVIDRGYFDNYGKAPIYLLVRDNDRDGNEEFFISENSTPNEADDFHMYGDGDRNGETDGDGYTSTWPEINVPYCDEAGEYKHSFIYTQIIKVYDDVRPIVTGDAAKFCIRDGGDCLANLKMVINGTDNCSDKVTLETQFLMIAPYQTLDASQMIMYGPKWSTKDLGNGNFEINVKDLAAQGTHDLIVVVRDECGNLSVPTRIPFTIADCKGPAPICINGLSVDLMPDGANGGMMAVWATDFVASKIYDCNGQDASKGDPSGRPLITKYSLNRVGAAKDKNATGINLNCADNGKVILVELHAWDEAGNDDFCVTYVEVQDNRNVCPGSTTGGSFNIAGTIATEGGAKLQGASISLSGAASQTATTTANGAYTFESMAKGGDFTISPQLDKNHLNGVSTFDLVLIQKHILSTQVLNSPYKMIAADVNNSKSITTLDLIVLRKLILNIDKSFQNNTSWRFVDATYQFPDASNPWAAAFPEVVSINDLAANSTANFIAVKVGDVNASATVSSATAAEVRTNGTLNINATEAALKAGQEYSVEFSTADLMDVQGYQFALNLDKRKVELVDIVYGVAKAENFGVFASEGIITTSWNLAEFATATAKQGALFTLVLRAKADAQLSSALSLNRILAPEAYNSNNDQLDLALTFNKVAVSNGFELKQNTPNPFNGETLINFNLPKATAATLTISDVTGRILKSVRATYAKGLNQVSLKASDLNASGVLYYTLETDDFAATKKMIIVE